MSEYKVGDVVTGKVTGIQAYGAFVALDENTQGLVHISEITHGFVKDIHDFLELEQEVKVRILDIDSEANKISLSIRATEENNHTISKKKPTRDDGKEDNGFHTLKEKLQEWIEKADK